MFCPHFLPPFPLCLTHSVRSAWRVCTSACAAQLIISLVLWMLRCISSSGISWECWLLAVQSWVCLQEFGWNGCLFQGYIPLLRGSQHSITRCCRVQGQSLCLNLEHFWGPIFKAFYEANWSLLQLHYSSVFPMLPHMCCSQEHSPTNLLHTNLYLSVSFPGNATSIPNKTFGNPQDESSGMGASCLVNSHSFLLSYKLNSNFI